MALLLAVRMMARTEMLTLTKRDLAVLDGAQPEYEVFLVETGEDDGKDERQGWWLMKVKIPSESKIYVVQTALGRTKLWKRLDIAMDFVKETCPRISTVHVLLRKEAT
ncbi:hypothetical protein [Caballeronia sordidicola]|nr:hypothetical protein [Caballeronia sordidicola]